MNTYTKKINLEFKFEKEKINDYNLCKNAFYIQKHRENRKKKKKN